MVFVMLVAGIGLVLAGLLAIAYGIGVQLSTGNTMIIAGVIGVCTGMIMLGFWTTVRELKNIARRLGNGPPEARGEAAARPAPPVAATRDAAHAGGGFPAAEPFGGSRPPRRRRLSLLRHRRHGRTKLYCAIIRFRSRCTPNRHRREIEAQFDVFIDVAKRTRARPDAVQRGAAAGSVVAGPSFQAAHRAAGRDRRTARVRRCLAESGSRKARRDFAAAAQQPHAPARVLKPMAVRRCLRISRR